MIYSKHWIIPGLIALAYAASSYAQTSVTLYGIADGGVAYFNHVVDATGASHALVKFSSGNISGDRWGMRGVEDLGGGLTAIVQLENGFNLGTGTLSQGGREFGRLSIVGLSGAAWGTAKLGRQNDASYDVVEPLTDDFYYNGTFAPAGDVDNYDSDVRINNSVKYISPTVGGVVFEALYSTNGVAGSAGNGQTYSFGLGYHEGNLALGAGYFFANGGNTTTAGVRTWTSSADSIFNSIVNQGLASSSSISSARVAAQYAIGDAKLGLSYSNTYYARDGFSRFAEDARFNTGSAYVNYQATPAARFGLGYSLTKSSGPASATYNQVNAAAAYSLSKRTDVYMLAAYQHATGTMLNGSGHVVPATASIGSTDINSGASSQTLFMAGMRQKF